MFVVKNPGIAKSSSFAAIPAHPNKSPIRLLSSRFAFLNGKIFLTASCEERANRRFLELDKKVKYEEILEDIKFRDKNDSTRKIDPLRPAEDAIIIDNTNLDLEGTINKIYDIVTEKTGVK